MSDEYFFGLIIVAIATGCLTTAAIGWLIFGGGLIIAALVRHINDGSEL